MHSLYRVGTCISFLDYAEQLVAPLDNFLSAAPHDFYARVLLSSGAAQRTPAQLCYFLCSFFLEQATSNHHVAAAAKLGDVVLLGPCRLLPNQTDDPPSTLPPSPGSPGQELVEPWMRLITTALREKVIPDTLRALLASNLLASATSHPQATVRSLTALGGLDLFESTAVLFASSSVLPLLRSHERRLVLTCLTSLILECLHADPSACLGAVMSFLMPSGALRAIAIEELQYLQEECSALQSGLDAGQADSHEGSEDSSDADTDSGMSLLDDGGEGEEDDIEGAVRGQDGSDIQTQQEFISALHEARRLAPRLNDDASHASSGSGECNFLDEQDFESPIDDWCVWRRFQWAAGVLSRHSFSCTRSDSLAKSIVQYLFEHAEGLNAAVALERHCFEAKRRIRDGGNVT